MPEGGAREEPGGDGTWWRLRREADGDGSPALRAVIVDAGQDRFEVRFSGGLVEIDTSGDWWIALSAHDLRRLADLVDEAERLAARGGPPPEDAGEPRSASC